MCGDTAAHVPFPHEPKVDGTRRPVVMRHGHIFIVYKKLVDMAAEEPDKPAPREISCHGRFGEPVRADGSGPPVP